MASAARHLAILREADLVRVRREGKWKFYSLPKKRSQLQSKLLGCVDSGQAIQPRRIEERLKEVSARMKDLRHVQRVLRAALTTCQEHEPSGRCGVIDTLSASARTKQP